MMELSSGGRLDSSGRRDTPATDALLGVLAAFVLMKLAPWGDYDVAGGVVSVLLGASGGVAVARLFRRRALIRINVILVVIYFVVALTPLMGVVSSWWVRVDALPAYPLDAVVALSGGLKSDSALGSTAADRLLSAIELVRDGRAHRLVTTRQVERFRGRLVTSDSDQARLISMASIADHWVIVDSVHNTHDEAVRSAALLLPAGARSIAVVTSPMHTRRACAVFAAAGFTVFCQASRERDTATNPPVGGSDRLAALRAWEYELMGMLEYRVRGWLSPSSSQADRP